MDHSQNLRAAPPLWRRLLPLVVTIIILGLIFWRIPFSRFAASLQKAHYLPFLSLMLPFSLYYFLLDTVVLWMVMRTFHGTITYRDLLPVRAVTYLVSLVNTQLGQGAMTLYLSRCLRVPLLEILSSVCFLILIEVTQLVLYATLGMLGFPTRVPPALFWIPVVWGLFLTLFLAGVRHQWFRLLPFPQLKREKNWTLLRTFVRAAPRHYGLVLLLKAPIFFAALLVHWLALQTFDIHIPLLRLFAFLPIVYLVAALPITVAHLGTAQAAWIFFFSPYADESSLLAYSIAAHLTFMLANATLGLVFLPTAYRDLFTSSDEASPS